MQREKKGNKRKKKKNTTNQKTPNRYRLDHQLEEGIRELDDLLDSQLDEKKALFSIIDHNWLN